MEDKMFMGIQKYIITASFFTLIIFSLALIRNYFVAKPRIYKDTSSFVFLWVLRFIALNGLFALSLIILDTLNMNLSSMQTNYENFIIACLTISSAYSCPLFNFDVLGNKPKRHSNMELLKSHENA
jgi:hypothetical protein